MSLSEQELSILSNAADRYSYPGFTWSVERNAPVQHANMTGVEQYIRERLISGDPAKVREGLASVVHWGHGNAGYQGVRRDRVLAINVAGFVQAALVLPELGVAPLCAQQLTAIKRLRLPELSQMPFVSKVLMFLDPERYVVLDNKLAQMGTQNGIVNMMSGLVVETTIRISLHNHAIYCRWVQLCRDLAPSIGKQRAVDVERAFFVLISEGHAVEAAAILAHAEA